MRSIKVRIARFVLCGALLLPTIFIGSVFIRLIFKYFVWNESETSESTNDNENVNSNLVFRDENNKTIEELLNQVITSLKDNKDLLSSLESKFNQFIRENA